MNGQDLHLTMIKTVTTTILYSLGIGLTFGSALAGVVAILQ